MQKMRRVLQLLLLSCVPAPARGFLQPSPLAAPRGHAAKKDEDDGRDPVEKLFNFFFGAVEQAPLGLDRMTPESRPDEYPAERTRRAAPVAGDDATCAKFVRPTLAQTGLEKRPLRLAYAASRDGWGPQKFHEKVDFQGPCVCLCLAPEDQRFGGYAPQGFVGYGELRSGISAFLFSWSGDSLLKLRKVGGAGVANLDEPEKGPFFGSEGLAVPMVKSEVRRCRVKLGPYYERVPGSGAKSFLAGQAPDVLLDDLLVYVGVYTSDENVPFARFTPGSWV